jgi:hypothetical protein
MSEYLDLDNLNHDPRLAEALGNMVVAWAKAETVLVNIFACVMNVHFNFATFAYYRILTFESRIKVITAILPEWESDKYSPKDIENAVAKLRKLSPARNDWIHGVWCIDRETSETVMFDFRAAEDTLSRQKIIKVNDIVVHVEAVRKRTATFEQMVPLYFVPP